MRIGRARDETNTLAAYIRAAPLHCPRLVLETKKAAAR